MVTDADSTANEDQALKAIDQALVLEGINKSEHLSSLIIKKF